MTIRDHDNSVSKKADTEGTKINAAETKRVLAQARALQKQDREAFLAWVRAVDPEAAEVLRFWRGSVERANRVKG